MDDAGLGDRLRPDRADWVREPAQPVADDHEHVVHASVLDLGEDVQPVLRALADLPAGHRGGLPGPQPEDVAAALAGHGERDVDRSVGDLPVADLHVDRVDEYHRIDRVQRRFCHSAMPSTTLSVIVEMVWRDTSAP